MNQQTQNKIEWKEIALGNNSYFEILSSGINKFENEKDYLSTESIRRTQIKKVECKITYKDRPSRANMQPVLNSVWFAKMKSTLKVYSFSQKNKEEAEEYILSTGFAGIKFNEKISSKYIKFFLLTKIFNDEKDKLSTGSTQSGINNSFISKIKIPIPFSKGSPDLKEQERIISILEKAEKVKAKGDNAGKLLDEYLKSVFNEMFYNKGFENKRFFEVFNITTGKLDSNAMEDNGKYPFFTCSQETFKINNYAFDCEALLLAGNNAAGKYSVKYYKGKFNAYQRTYVLTLKEKDDFKYLHFVLINKLEELRRISIGTNTKYLTLGLFKGIKIPLPPPLLQQKFAKIVEHVEGLKENVKRTKQNSEELFDNLMQKAFRGEL